MQAGIKEILIITTPNDHELFLELSRPGFLFYFSKQKLFNVYKCQDKEKILKVINPYNDEL